MTVATVMQQERLWCTCAHIMPELELDKSGAVQDLASLYLVLW